MNRNTLKEMVSTKNKNKVLSCSTPEHNAESPSHDSDSICDSEAASPVPFLCTQDGAEGEMDVVWNYYTPKSDNIAIPRTRDSTPLSHKTKRSLRPKVIQKQLPKRRPIKSSQKKTELFQDLIELNKNLHELISSKKQSSCVNNPQEDDDIFNESPDSSPKCIPRSNSRCLRKNVLSSNFGRTEPETALESDDSMNECLLKASQIVEDKILNCEPSQPKRTKFTHKKQNYKTEINFKMDHDSMDAILNSIKLDSPVVNKVKKIGSPCINNDSFDSLVGNLNDSALEQLTQMPVKSDFSKNKLNERSKDWTVNELVIHDSSPMSKSFFGRHNSMPESPSVTDCNKPSTSGMVFGRYNSMPYPNHETSQLVSGDSPIRCTPDEIKKKHKLAREKLMAKRLLPFTSSQCTQPIPSQTVAEKKQFQPKVATSSITSNKINSKEDLCDTRQLPRNNSNDIKSIIEKKRQEALMKLRRKQPYNNK